MRSMMIAAFLALGLMATPVFAQDAKDVEKDDVRKEQAEKKEAEKLNVYEATITGMT